jgi:molecular chaperone HtpG
MQQGTINVQTENIFPIIKKFLYSDHEIFLRELIANAIDATQKMKTLNAVGEMKSNLEKLQVEVILDKAAGTLTVRDNGIGMTADEVERYINQIAFSGAEEFVNKYKDATDQIIGHFGLGFYSAFMVSKEVEIITRSQKPNSTAVHWRCDGSPNFTLEETNKKTKGTDIVMHIADDSLEFLEDDRIKGILSKYCKFMPVAIRYGDRTESIDDPKGAKDDKGEIKKVQVKVPNIINNTDPAWCKKPADLTDENYTEFYRELYPMTMEDPLFHIHLNVDYPFNLTGVLYFPKIKNNFEIQKNKINLYCNQVFITDNVENIVPEFLTLLHGVIDSPDIPLNVSRSYLQADSNVKKISGHITKKVADKLQSMFNTDREDFTSKWDDIRIFMEYGMLTEEKFFDKAEKFYMYKTTADQYFTHEEFIEKIKETQKDKNDKIVVLYSNDAVEQHSFIESATERGYEVVIMDTQLSSHLLTRLEGKHNGIQFVRVDADTIDKLIDKEDAMPSKMTEDEQNELKPVLESVVEDGKFTVVFESMSEKDAPMVITENEFMRRMKEQQMAGGGGMQMFGQLPETYNLVVNSNHPLMAKILGEKDEALRKSMAKQTADLALLSKGLLKGKDLTTFIKRSVDLIN